VVGVIERSITGTLFCTILYISPEGRLLHKHRKVMPTASERLVWGFGDGQGVSVLSTPIGKIGGAICWENYMPMLRMSLYAQGIQIYCAPTADSRDTWLSTMIHIAVEGRCYVLSSNQYVLRQDLPSDYPGFIDMGPSDVVCRGGSCIVSPFGDVLAGPKYDGEGLLYAELDLAETLRGKMDLDVAGHYARGDIFQLHVNKKSTEAVQFLE